MYVGEWKNGNREGYGCMYWAKSGDRYEGHWANDNLAGYGTYVWGDDARYSPFLSSSTQHTLFLCCS
jgi:hypothetical protein